MPAPRPASPVSARLVDRNFVLIFLGAFCFNMDYTLYFLLPHYLELRGTSEAFYGAVAGSFGLSAFVFMLLLGHLGDAWPRKWQVLVYLLPFQAANVLAVLAYRAAPEWYFAVRILHGFSAGLAIPLLYTWSVELGAPQRRTEILAYMGMNFLIASILGPFLGEVLLAWFPTPQPADAYLALFAVSVALSVGGHAMLLAVSASPMRPHRESWLALVGMIRRPASLLLLGLVLIFGGIYGVFFAFGKNYVAGMDLGFASVLFAGYAAGSIISRLVFRPMLLLFGELNLIPLGMTSFALSFLLLSVATTYPLLGMSGLLCGLSHTMLAPTTTSRLLALQRPAELGRATVIWYGTWGGGAGLFPYLGGFLLESVSFPTLYQWMAVVCLLSVGLHYLTNLAAPGQIAMLQETAVLQATKAPAAAEGAPAERTFDSVAPRRTVTRVVTIRRA
jgi:MFS family permease